MILKELFDMEYGDSLELINCDIAKKDDEEYINFISRTSENNGVSAKVKRIETIQPHPAGTLTCALSGSVLSTFVQTKPYYTSFHIFVLTPKTEMSINEKLFWCSAIKANAYKYSYGRQANKTLGEIEVPDFVPHWVFEVDVKPPTTNNYRSNKVVFDNNRWHSFYLKEIFKIKKGKRLTSSDQIDGDIPYIGAINSNNGIANYIAQNPIHKSNTISLSYNGSIGEAFYQPNDFWATDDVNVLYPRDKDSFNIFNAMFICTILKLEKYRYSYGRKWTLDKMNDTVIELPAVVSEYGEYKPDWVYMENYIKRLPYGDLINNS